MHRHGCEIDSSLDRWKENAQGLFEGPDAGHVGMMRSEHHSLMHLFKVPQCDLDPRHAGLFEQA